MNPNISDLDYALAMMAIVEINVATLRGLYAAAIGFRIDMPEHCQIVVDVETQAIESSPDVAFSHALSFWKHLRQTEDFPAAIHAMLDKAIAKGEAHRATCDCHESPGMIEAEAHAFDALSDLAAEHRAELNVPSSVLRAQVEEIMQARAFEQAPQLELEQAVGNMLGVALPTFGRMPGTDWEN